MKITRVLPGSIAAELDIRPGDELTAVNGHAVEDVIDYRFYLQDDDLELEIRRGEETTVYEIEDLGGEDPGLEFEEMKCRSCGNRCVFCFVDQNPPSVRPTLMFKDEDYRLSFLHGSYVTLTNTSRRHLRRIVEQRLSPLYISVHAVDTEVRRRLLGLRKDDRLMEKIAFLAENGIVMHAQIVLCPGWNDGAVLDETVERLADFYPQLRTVAVVPVGLTAHRRGLTDLTSVTAETAEKIILRSSEWGERFTAMFGSRFVYLADEFFLSAGRPIPGADYYEDFAQLENGVGMVRRLLDDFEEEKALLPRAVRPQRIDIVTGRLAAPVLSQFILPTLRRIKGCDVALRPIDNRFFGGGVTVSGLLTGGDIAAQLAGTTDADLVVLPPDCLNHDALFLDDWDVPRLEEALQRPVMTSNGSFLDIFRQIK